MPIDPARSLKFAALIHAVILILLPSYACAFSAGNIPLDSPAYLYLEKLAGMGLITSDVKGIRPFSKAEAARLVLEAENSSAGQTANPFAADLIQRLRDLFPREVSLTRNQVAPPLLDIAPLLYARLRYVYLDGEPRSYVRDVFDPGGQSVFGFIGGNLRPIGEGGVHTTGTEGTPLLENNEGMIYRHGHNADFRAGFEAYVSDAVTGVIEPALTAQPDGLSLQLHRGYLKLGGDGLELQVGRDANWFGPGYRGATTLTNNAKNFDILKVSSPEPLDVGWVKEYLGEFKYALIVSRFDATGSGDSYRRPWFVGLKLALKPKPWLEVGANVVRQQGGPGLQGDPSLKDQIFGGGDNDHINSIAGIDLRFRIPWLRNTEIYGEYSGEDSAGFWPFVESYVGGVFIPNLTADGRNDLRFEYYWGSIIAYGDWQFPAGYVYNNMTPGHSQGGAAQDFFVRYSHWYSARNVVALEYFHTDRGKVGKVAGQAAESKDAGRVNWRLPLYGDTDVSLRYGYERIRNVDLVPGASRSNQIFVMDLNYRY